ncbi:Fic family protein [Fodinibius saliphilus]|uniref:Fic family protein n=1 Tax=Fodinibius saliphilus TaxID=1920650 RepID=UPI00110994AC|nr:Fic family protein [Fodinibius saliphilus]
MKNFKAGTYINQDHYQSFQPNAVNRQWQLESMEIVDLLSQADRQLGRLDMYSEYIPNIDLFISMHVAKEATQSSKIEGTQTKVEEALLDKERVAPEKRDDWEEVQNYIAAMDAAINELEELPFSSRLIKNTHKVLMQGVRGEQKQPGQFRTSQNWIGGATIKDALFIPPIHESIPELMSDLEHFVHNEEIYLPDLIKIAIVHYQFETIHPFLDGNGRVGRLMITLYLVSQGILKQPILYLSDFFERHRQAYYDNLMRVREKDDIIQWIKFFLAGVIDTAKSGIKTFDAIMQLQQQVDHDLQEMGKRVGKAQQVIRQLYERPIITAEGVSKAADVSMPTAYKLIRSLEDVDILTEVTGAERNRLYVFKQYINLFE